MPYPTRAACRPTYSYGPVTPYNLLVWPGHGAGGGNGNEYEEVLVAV